MLYELFCALLLGGIVSRRENYHLNLHMVQGNFFDQVSDRFVKMQNAITNRNLIDDKKNSEVEELLEFLDEKPWRAGKTKYLTYEYLPWKDSWKERYRNVSDDTVSIYTIPEYRLPGDKTRLDEIWTWPWMWTKTKSERLSWMYKQFVTDVEALSVQEHMEMDALFSEYDMPTRWGILRMKEIDVLNVIVLNLIFWTDFNGIKPTDLGLRPDGSLRTCPVQFHNCISSSNNPLDIDHYAPPFKWDRGKSPDQAYDEIKNVYKNYPKRGLKWSSGWIDRGGWKPQTFSGPYFYAQADTLAFQFTDDIELVLDTEKRELQYRSSARLGQTDWDVQRLRYNQFARMLESKGGWEVQKLERLHWVTSTPFRWTQLLLDKINVQFQNVITNVIHTDNSMSSTKSNDDDPIKRQVNEFLLFVQQYKASLSETLDQMISNPDVKPYFDNIENIEKALESLLHPESNENIQQINKFMNNIMGEFDKNELERIGDNTKSLIPNVNIEAVDKIMESIIPDIIDNASNFDENENAAVANSLTDVEYIVENNSPKNEKIKVSTKPILSKIDQMILQTQLNDLKRMNKPDYY
jgi:uncharacterized protein (DUF1499 family)